MANKLKHLIELKIQEYKYMHAISDEKHPKQICVMQTSMLLLLIQLQKKKKMNRNVKILYLKRKL